MSDHASRAELEALRAEVAALRAAVDEARELGRQTMRRHRCCPACGDRRLAHAAEVLDRGDDGKRFPMALNQPWRWANNVVGVFEAYVCRACGLVEWYVRDPSALREIEPNLVFIDEGSASGPYR